MTALLTRTSTTGFLLLAAMATANAAWATLAGASAADLPLLWWAARALGFVAYVALTLSMLFGVLVSARGLDAWVARKTVLDLHQQWALAALISTVLHILTAVVHTESHISLVEALVPFAAERLTGALALGAIATWGLVVLAITSWLRKRISYTLWRAIHAFAFGAFVLAVVHSVAAGTDSAQPFVQWFYIVTTAVVTAAVVFRVLVALAGRTRASRVVRTG
ncbi:MAG: ferric reductase-like transmembrane domain-containing protein [Dehalococcoidia bacterium]|nr:ferric reductase-like transmembrane domain-containing protein [Dehalococcoidia bacterium]